MSISTATRNLLSLLMITSIVFNASAQKPKLNGYIKGINDKPIIFWYSLKGERYKDTVYAKNDHFVYFPKPSDEGSISIFISAPRFTSFWYENADIQLSGHVEKPYALVVKGGSENNILTLYNTTIYWPFVDRIAKASNAEFMKAREDKHKATLDFIAKYPNAKTSAELLEGETSYSNDDIKIYEKLYAGFSPSVKKSLNGVEVMKRINIIKNQPVIGKKAIDFTLADTSGKKVTLSSFQGKYVLLDFWGHWCSPCIRAFPELVKIHEQYPDKLVMIGVAAEHSDDKSKWIQAINKGNAKWIQVSELQGDHGELSTRYNIVEWPTYFLLDPNGIVVGRVNHVEELKKVLELVK
ncbi:TlpA disulfide reductase family protein [Dyadobacter sp. CY356]|uniref:TlpA family protein disulfide reductase n=1 Tax=Dyadobacter sp. CY356 TaxID=2906442 RepID=UPI001F1B2374|nr:TlpA disulfide reductase family protein [Dyadobacter sp. CY356]MCF0056030.1 TlpA family protein disulfide reductase [Dyadobacter sp. CY356]